MAMSMETRASNPSGAAKQDDWLLKVEDLKISFQKGHGRLLPVVDSANLSLRPHEAVGIVGESGSGKSMLCRALIGTLARHEAVITSGSILFEGSDLALASESVWRQVRGRRLGYVPQSSLAGLNPVLSIGTQLAESIMAVKPVGRRDAEKQSLDLLERVRIPRAKDVLRERPHQLSGGMRQRVMIATALAQEPRLLIADEPTTALDVTIQREILALLASLRQELGMALILVSHDLAVIEEVCDSIMVMYAGASVEFGPIDAVINAPRHPYTRALRDSRVDTALPGDSLETIPGEPLTVGSWPPGCRFWPRCPLADEACQHGPQPGLIAVARQLTACIHADRMDS